VSYQARSRWEAGDPIYDALAAAERRDHAWAQARGRRLRALTDAIVTALDVPALLPAAHHADARVAIFTVLADHLYGLAAIDVPDLRKDPEP
jgi:hypothetical protein